MREFILKLFFGNDALVEHMANMLRARKAAYKFNKRFRKLSVKAANAQANLAESVTAYKDHKASLEKSYELDLS